MVSATGVHRTEGFTLAREISPSTHGEFLEESLGREPSRSGACARLLDRIRAGAALVGKRWLTVTA